MTLSLKFLGVSLILLVLGFTGIFNPIRNLAHQISNPIQYGLHVFSNNIKVAGEFFVTLKDIRNENLRLREEKQTLFSKLTQFNELENENKILKEQLGIKNTSSTQKLILVHVIGLPFDNENSEVLIDKGSKDGVKVGAEVIYKNYLVGSAVDVFENRSTVVFITSPKLSVAVLDQSIEGRTKGLVTGNYGISLLMDRILPDEEIKVGDDIVTSGQDGIFDPGLIVGKVIEISDVKSDPLKKAKLQTAIDLNRLESFFVVVK